MRSRALGQSGIQASVVGFGAWAIGGSVIAGRREQVALATKCGLVWHTAKGRLFFEQAGKPVYRCLGAESIRYELEQSLKRLRTDHIDLYQTHWQDATTPVEETMAGHEAAPIPYCREQGIAVLAYSPLAHGLLTGKIGRERKFKGDDLRRNDPRFAPKVRAKVEGMPDRIRPIAERHGITLGQLVIAWTVAQPGVTHALVGARNPQQAVENAHAGAVELTSDDVNEINNVFGQSILGGAQ